MESGTSFRIETVARREHVLPRLTWAATVAAVWAAAGGTAGGALVALLLIAGRMHPSGSVTAALVLSVIGGCLGLVHGAVLGRLSSGHGPAPDYATRFLGVAVAATALLGAAALSVWLATSAVLARSGRLWGWVALLAGGAAAIALAIVATRLGWTALERAWSEWRERRLGILLVAGTFAVLTMVFLVIKPALPGAPGGLTTLGWLIVVAFATLWIATPLVVVALRTAFRQKRGPQ
jgi:hypothetical protein